jgi:hypothetical protein
MAAVKKTEAAGNSHGNQSSWKPRAVSARKNGPPREAAGAGWRADDGDCGSFGCDVGVATKNGGTGASQRRNGLVGLVVTPQCGPHPDQWVRVCLRQDAHVEPRQRDWAASGSEGK